MTLRNPLERLEPTSETETNHLLTKCLEVGDCVRSYVWPHAGANKEASMPVRNPPAPPAPLDPTQPTQGDDLDLADPPPHVQAGYDAITPAEWALAAADYDRYLDLRAFMG